MVGIPISDNPFALARYRARLKNSMTCRFKNLGLAMDKDRIKGSA
jgi:hypothetical protein